MVFKKEKCAKCGEDLVLGYCSYPCLKEKAKEKGVPVETLLLEMENVAKAFHLASLQHKNSEDIDDSL